MWGLSARVNNNGLKKGDSVITKYLDFFNQGLLLTPHGISEKTHGLQSLKIP